MTRSGFLLCTVLAAELMTGGDLRGQSSTAQAGTEVTVQKRSGSIVMGRLMAATKDALVVRRALNESASIPWSDIRKISGGTNTHPWMWAAGGAAVGAVAGVITGKPKSETFDYFFGSIEFESKPDTRAQDALLYGAAGAVALGLGAYLLDTHFEYDLASMDAQEVVGAKRELNELAHYPDADERTDALAADVKTTAKESGFAGVGAPAGLADVDRDIPTGTVQRPYAVAVVIGNTNNHNAHVPAVEYASRDAQSMKEYLMKMFGYKEANIMCVENASRADFKAIFGTTSNFKGKLFNSVKPGQSDVFIYYTGHGAPNPESNEAYLVPVDCDPAQAARNGYSLKTLYDNLSRIRYKSLTVVIDASFSGDTETGMLLQDTSPVYIEEEDPLLKIKNAVVMTSAAGSQISSWYPEKGHSLFTYFLLRGLRGEADESGDNTVTLGELKNYVTDNVGSLARKLSSREQTPQIFGNPGQPLLNVR